jgi:DNA-binding NarL/FixJ family response regulator
MAIRVLVADDHPMLRAGLRAILAGEPDISLIGEATRGEEAQRLAENLRPDVLLLDLSMPGPPAAETVRFIQAHAPSTSVVILTAYQDAAALHELMALGARGYVLKDEPVEAVAEAIRAVARGGIWLSRQVMPELLHDQPEETGTMAEPQFSERERQVLSLLEEGWDNKHIGEEMHLTEQTVRNYLRHIYDKLGVHSRTEALVWLRKYRSGG